MDRRKTNLFTLIVYLCTDVADRGKNNLVCLLLVEVGGWLIVPGNVNWRPLYTVVMLCQLGMVVFF